MKTKKKQIVFFQKKMLLTLALFGMLRKIFFVILFIPTPICFSIKTIPKISILLIVTTLILFYLLLKPSFVILGISFFPLVLIITTIISIFIFGHFDQIRQWKIR